MLYVIGVLIRLRRSFFIDTHTLILFIVAIVSFISSIVFMVRYYRVSEEYARSLNIINASVASTSSKLVNIDVRLTMLEEDIELSENADTPQEHLSSFDAKIAQYREELNTPTYAENNAITYNPNVYNEDHNVITDTPLRYEEEYAE